MQQFQFALTSVNLVREAGVVQSESFTDALDAIDQNCMLTEGDTLEIGVPGFPPARFERIAALSGPGQAWRSSGLLAA